MSRHSNWRKTRYLKRRYWKMRRRYQIAVAIAVALAICLLVIAIQY